MEVEEGSKYGHGYEYGCGDCFLNLKSDSYGCACEDESIGIRIGKYTVVLMEMQLWQGLTGISLSIAESKDIVSTKNAGLHQRYISQHRIQIHISAQNTFPRRMDLPTSTSIRRRISTLVLEDDRRDTASVYAKLSRDVSRSITHHRHHLMRRQVAMQSFV